MVESGPSKLKRGYTYWMLGVLAVFFILGGLNELVANLAPQLMPEFISNPLKQSGYGLLHAHPVVKWWTRLHNLANVGAGFALMLALPGLMSQRHQSWRVTLGVLVYIISAGVVGGVLLYVFLFPVLDTLADQLPVSPSNMKFAMFMAPASLMLVGMIKTRFLWRWRSYYCPDIVTDESAS